MMPSFRSLSNRLRRLRYGSPVLRDFRASSRADSRRHGAGAPLVALQCVEDGFYLAMFDAIVAAFRQDRPVRAECIVIRSIQIGRQSGLRSHLRKGRLADGRWIRAYLRFCEAVAYWSRHALPAAAEDEIRARALRLLQACPDVDSLVTLEVDGILIGDLLVDTYLRFRPAVHADVTDSFFVDLMVQALRDLAKAKAYFSTSRPQLYLTSYTTYIQHGVPARVALAEGVTVVSFGNYQESFKVNSLADLRHTKASASYREEFAELADPDAARALGTEALERRVTGRVDLSTAYMRQSAYGEATTGAPDVAGAVIVFLHDFFDSPHIYQWMLFHDFWEWATFTIEALQTSGQKFFLKPHPNQVAGNSEAISRLKDLYPDVRFLDLDISNSQLVNGGIASAVTVYGTVASEMAYLGVPSIGSGDAPHASFDFCHIARTRDEYRALLGRADQLPFDHAEARTQTAEFYYMHNIAERTGFPADRDALIGARVAMTRAEGAGAYCLDELEGLKAFFRSDGFRAMIEQLEKRL